MEQSYSVFVLGWLLSYSNQPLFFIGNRSKIYREHLLNSDFEPATNREIGRWLGVDENKAGQILEDLEDVGLLEQVTLPNFDAIEDQEGKTTEAKKTKDGKPASKKKTDSKKVSRAHTSQHEPTRAPLKTKAKAKGKATNGKTTAVGSKVKENDNGNDNGIEQTQQTGQPLEGQDQVQGQRREENRTASAPTTTPPLPSVPQGSDEGGRVTPFARPPDSVESGVYSSSGMTYGRRIYRALDFVWDVDSPEANREITSFASKHDRIVTSGLSPPVVVSILNRGWRTEAPKIAKRKGNRNKAAVWNKVMNNILAAKQQEKLAAR